MKTRRKRRISETVGTECDWTHFLNVINVMRKGREDIKNITSIINLNLGEPREWDILKNKKKKEKGREEREFKWKMTLVSDIRILNINPLLI